MTATKKGAAVLDQHLPDHMKSSFHVLQLVYKFELVSYLSNLSTFFNCVEVFFFFGNFDSFFSLYVAKWQNTWLRSWDFNIKLISRLIFLLTMFSLCLHWVTNSFSLLTVCFIIYSQEHCALIPIFLFTYRWVLMQL